MRSDLQDQILTKIAKKMQEEIDDLTLWALECASLKEQGWTRVILSYPNSNKNAVDIMCWLEDNCKESHERNGRDFMFESEKDAVNFILRWS